MEECKEPGKFISPDFKNIFCEVHKKRQDNHREYIKITKINDGISRILDQLEMAFIDFQTCLTIVEMFLKEKKVLSLDLNALKKLQENLNEEMKILNNRFSEGTFYPNIFQVFIKNF
jgi:hypothetical protein